MPSIWPGFRVSSRFERTAVHRYRARYSSPVRIALVSPYSWTYPGGVTRHIEALSAELRSRARTRILAPFDPDDALSRRVCTAGRAHSGVEPPENFVSLGRTIGIPANGAVSNLTGTPQAVFAIRRELRSGGYDVAHIHEPIVPHDRLGRAHVLRGAAARGHVPHLLHQSGSPTASARS